MIENLVHWIVGIIISVAPPGVQHHLPKQKANEPAWIANARETESEALERYNSIASDLVEVVFDEQVQPLFDGPNGRTHTAVLMLGIMKHESGFRKDVDKNIGPRARGDNGRSWCMLQMNIGKGRTQAWNFVQHREPKWGDLKEEIRKGYLGTQLIEDRKLCFSEGLNLITRSFKAGTKLEDKLRIFASGKFKVSNPAKQKNIESASKNRISTGEYLWTKNNKEITWKDNDIISLLKERKVQIKRQQDLDKMNPKKFQLNLNLVALQ